MSDIGRLRQLQSEVRRLDNMISEMIKKSFCDSENLEEPRDYPQSVGDIIDETRHGGNMLAQRRK